MTWVKGQSGNPQGARCWKDKPISVLARSHAPIALKRLVSIVKDDNAPAAAHVAASQAILDRAYGKAPTFSTSDAGELRKALDLSDDQLASIAASVIPLKLVGSKT